MSTQENPACMYLKTKDYLINTDEQKAIKTATCYKNKLNVNWNTLLLNMLKLQMLMNLSKEKITVIRFPNEIFQFSGDT